MPDRFQIAASLREIGRLLGVKGDNPFKAQAYDRGARALENLQDDLDALIKARRLTAIPGIGAALASVIEEIYRTGECWMLQKLREELPPGAVELSEIPGLSLKKIIALHDTLNIESVADLKTACQEGLVRSVKGFGEKSAAKLLADIEKLDRHEERTLLPRALNEAGHILEYLRGAPELIEAEIAGALRRFRETVRKVSIVASSKNPKAVLDRFLSFPALARTSELDEDHCVGVLASGLQAELTVASPADYIAALHLATGSKSHMAKLKAMAGGKSMAMGAAGQSKKAHKEQKVKSEEDIYKRLNLQYIPPELREDEGEIEAAAAGTLPQLVTFDDIRGLVHCHTVYSDGQNTIEEMGLAADALGMQYLTITDHSPTAYYARGVEIDRLRAQWDEIARVQETVKVRLLKGTESDITQGGTLDYPDHILERFDVIIASIHARNKMNSDQMTHRLKSVFELPVFKIWGHPLGRIIQSRPPFECRMEELLDVIAASKAAIEVNGDPHRLDLEPRWIRAARARGIRFVISTDAHSIAGLGYLRYGVAMARRGWLGREDILNALDAEDFMRAVHP